MKNTLFCTTILLFFALDALIAQSPVIRYTGYKSHNLEEVTINDDYEFIEEIYPKNGDTVYIKKYFANRHLIDEGLFVKNGVNETPIGEHTYYLRDTIGIYSKSLFQNGNEVKLQTYYRSGKLKRIELYNEDHTLVSGQKYAEDGTELPFTPHEQMPMYPGGEPAMMKFLSENISYPKKARKKNIQGTVALSFIVEKDGHLSNVKVLRSVGGGCDEEAVRVIKSMPNWTPAMHDDNPVRVKFTIPIKFRLG